MVVFLFTIFQTLLFAPLLVESVFRKNYVIERVETWNGDEYLVREEQPFFRVYHEPHTKVAREDPNSGKLNPLQSQLAEEHGSDQRLRIAAQFWREHNKQHQNGEEEGGGGGEGSRMARRNKRADEIDKIDGQTDPKALGEFMKNGGGGGSENGGGGMMMGNRGGGGGGGRREGMEEGDGANNNAMKEQQQQQPNADETLTMQILERNQNRSSAKFGHHHLPTGEQKDTATWPWQLMPFMPCLSMECICPLFRGSVQGNLCILPTGKPLRRAIRKEFRTYSPEEMTLFVEVMRRFKSSGLYSRFGLIHRRSGVHSGPSFFPWHREFLKRLEIVFRALHPENVEPILGIPYWDSSLDGDLPSPEESIIFSNILLGEPNESGFVTNGLFANWTTMDGRHSYQRMFGDQPDGEFFNEARIDFILSQTQIDRVMAFSLPLHSCVNYTMDDRFLEYSHDYVHYLISGDMQERFSSSNDPIFFMHHGFVDSIWELWRQKKQTRLQREREYPRDDGECMPEWHFSYSYMPLLQPLRNMDALSNNYTDNMYEYAPRPTCQKSGKSEECGNTEFLWCDTRSHPDGHSVCSAKVKPEGNCKGFEWSTEICYNGGKCMPNGRCSGGMAKEGGGGERMKMEIPKGEWQNAESFMRRR